MLGPPKRPHEACKKHSPLPQASDPWSSFSGRSAFQSFRNVEKDEGEGASQGETQSKDDSPSAAADSTSTISQMLPGDYVEQIRAYIPAEVMALWATVKQLLDILFDGTVNTPSETYIFVIVWAGAAPPSTLCTVLR